MSQPEPTSPSSQHLGRIARAASLVMVLFIVSRVLGLLRENVIARQFGTSAELDAYLAAFRIPDFLFYVIAGGALGSAFIPVFSSFLAREDDAGAWRLASAVINAMFLVLTGLSLLAAIFAPTIVSTFFSEFTPSQQALTVELMRWMLISTVIFGISGVIMGILNAKQHFLLPALAPAMYNVAIIAGAIFLGPTWGVRGLAAGVVVGALLHLLVQLPGLRQFQMRYALIVDWADASLREVGRLMAPRMLGLMAVQLNFVVNVILASGLAVGSVAALNFGWITMLLPQGVIAQSVATALFPTLAALVARGEQAEMRRIFGTTLRNLLFLTLPATAGLMILSVPIIRLLFEYGEFDQQSTAMSAWALSLFAVGLVGHAVVEIAARAFYALKDTVTPVAAGIGAMALNVALSIWFIGLFTDLGWMPLGGLALANSLAVLLEMVVLLWLLRTPMGGLAEGGIGRSLGKMGLATLAMVLALLTLQWLLPAWSATRLGGLLTMAVGGGVYFGAAYLLRAEELLAVTRRVLARVSRR